MSLPVPSLLKQSHVSYTKGPYCTVSVKKQNLQCDKLVLPQLTRRNANHVKDIIVDTKTVKNYVPHPRIIQQYASYPYFNYNEILINGYITMLEQQCYNEYNEYNEATVITSSYCSVSPQITDLCQQYYFVTEDGIFELAYKISRILKKLNRNGITIKILTIIIMKYLHVKEHEATSYCNELIQFEYIIPVQSKYNKSNQLYQISMTMSILFNRK